MAYVSEDGNFGSDGVLVFEDSALTPEQWDTLDGLSDYDKYDYVQAILAGEDVSKYE